MHSEVMVNSTNNQASILNRETRYAGTSDNEPYMGNHRNSRVTRILEIAIAISCCIGNTNNQHSYYTEIMALCKALIKGPIANSYGQVAFT